MPIFFNVFHIIFNLLLPVSQNRIFFPNGTRKILELKNTKVYSKNLQIRLINHDQNIDKRKWCR